MKCLLLFILIFACGQCLNKFLKHYEPLEYQPAEMKRVSRSSDDRIRLKFGAYGRNFKLLLGKVPEKDSVFMHDATVDFWNETTPMEWESALHEGIVEGDDSSRVFGSMHDGIFEGMIRMGDGDEFWIESTLTYSSNASFHSFIYSLDDIDMPVSTAAHSRPARSTPYPDENRSAHPRQARYALHETPPVENCNAQNAKQPGASQAEAMMSEPISQMFSRRLSRSPSMMNDAYTNRICPIFAQVDYTLYEWMSKGRGNGDHLRTRRLLIDLIKEQFAHVNDIYDKVDFDGIKHIKFTIAAIKIWRSKYDAFNPYSMETNNNSLFLDWNAAQDHSKYCLAYVFSYRSFEKSVQGYAYECAICTKFQHGKSENTGVLSYYVNGNEIARARWYTTFAHEIGHNMGSRHDQFDSSADCVHKDGFFIMNQFSNSGKDTNNLKFSPCSIRNITRNLKELMKLHPDTNTHAGIRQANCFLEHDTPICGNGIIETGEMCDCGYDDAECLEGDDSMKGDKCCYPANDPLKRGCTIKTGMDCSPLQGECCNADCSYKPIGDTCEAATDCAKVALCPGDSAVCPKAVAINENKLCDDISGTCVSGACTGSVCATRGMEDCDVDKDTCILYCKSEGVCKSTEYLTEFAFTNYSQRGRWGHYGIMKKPGELCKNGRGQCDHTDNCRDLVPLDNVGDGETSKLHSFGEYLAKNYWILIILGLVAVTILAIAVVFCYYKVPRLSWRTPPRDFWDSTSGRKGDTVPIETKVETCKAKSDSNSSKRRKNGKKADIAKADEAKVGAKTKDDLKAKKRKSKEPKKKSKETKTQSKEAKSKLKDTKSKSKSKSVEDKSQKEDKPMAKTPGASSVTSRTKGTWTGTNSQTKSGREKSKD